MRANASTGRCGAGGTSAGASATRSGGTSGTSGGRPAAAVASGLPVATWVRRPGLAAALAAVIGVFFNDGYPFFTRNLYDAFGEGPGLLLASPTYGVSWLLYVQQEPLYAPRYAATAQY